jgi:hypothetical protein
VVVFGRRPMVRRWLAFAALAYALMGGGQMAFTVEGFAHGGLLLDDRRPCRSGIGGPSGGTSVRKEGICRRAATVLLGKSVGAGGGDEDAEGGKRGGRSKFEGNEGVERQGRSSRPASKGGSNSGQRTSSPLLGFNDGVISEDGTPPTNPLMRRVWEIQKLKAESERKKNAGEARKASKLQQQTAMPEKRGGSDMSLTEEKVVSASKQDKGKARDRGMSLDAELSELQAVALTLLTSSEVLDEDVDMTPTIEGIRRIKGEIFAKTANWPKTKAEASNTAKDGGELDDEMRDIIDKAIDILKEVHSMRNTSLHPLVLSILLWLRPFLSLPLIASFSSSSPSLPPLPLFLLSLSSSSPSSISPPLLF